MGSIEDIILPESKDIVRKTHEMVTAWKSGTRRKRFRCQNVKAQRNDLSINLTRLFCQNSDYESLELIQTGINMEKNATMKIVKERIEKLPRKTSLQDDHDRKITKIESCTGKPRNTGIIYITHCYKKYHSLLEKAFEENGGYIQGEKLDELIAATNGEITRKKLLNWFYQKRKKYGFEPMRTTPYVRFSARQTSLLEEAFAENSGYVNYDKLEELERTLELNRSQIINWFWRNRSKNGVSINC